MAGQVLTWLTGVISDPVNTLGEISRQKPVGWALLVYLLATLLTLLSLEISPVIVFVVWPLFVVLGMVVMAGLFHLTALLLGGRGAFEGGISILGFVGFLCFLIPPLYLLGMLGGPPGRILGFMLTLLIMVWGLLLYVIGIRENYRLTVGKSVVVILAPLILAGLLVVTVGLLISIIAALIIMML